MIREEEKFRFDCIEEFADHFNMPLYAAEKIFQDYGLNEMIYRDYRDLKRMRKAMPLWSFFYDCIKTADDPSYESDYYHQ